MQFRVFAATRMCVRDACNNPAIEQRDGLVEQRGESEFGDLRQEATRIWDRLAGWWDGQTGK